MGNAYRYDSDDYKPFEEIEIGDIVRYEMDPDEEWKVLAKGHGIDEFRKTLNADPKLRFMPMPHEYGMEDDEVEDWVITDGTYDQPYIFWGYGPGGVYGHYSDDNADESQLAEDDMQDSDIPYEELEIDDTVVDENSGEEFKVLEILGDGKLIVALADDPRDVRGVIYGQDVTKVLN